MFDAGFLDWLVAGEPYAHRTDRFVYLSPPLQPLPIRRFQSGGNRNQRSYRRSPAARYGAAFVSGPAPGDERSRRPLPFQRPPPRPAKLPLTKPRLPSGSRQPGRLFAAKNPPQVYSPHPPLTP